MGDRSFVIASVITFLHPCFGSFMHFDDSKQKRLPTDIDAKISHPWRMSAKKKSGAVHENC